MSTVLQRPEAGRAPVEPNAGPRRRSPFGHRSVFTGVGALVAITMALLVFTPVTLMIYRAFVTPEGISLAPFQNALELRGIGSSIRNSIVVLIVAGTLATTIGTAFAWLNERTDARLGLLGDVLPLAPLLLPKVAMSIGWVFLAAPQAGFLNVIIRKIAAVFGIVIETGPLDIFTWPGLIFLFTMDFIPFAFLVMATGFRNLDPALEEASRVSGASRWTTFRKVSLPAIRPALGASAFFMVIAGLSVFSIPTIIGTQAGIPMLSVRIVRLLRGQYPPQIGEAVVLSLLMLSIIGLAWCIQHLIAGKRGRSSTIGGKAIGTSQFQLGRWRWVAIGIVGLFLSFTIVFPIIGLVWVSLQPFWHPDFNLSSASFEAYDVVLRQNRMTLDALKNSVTYGIIGATVGVSITTLMLVTARRVRGTSSKLIEGTIRIPSGLSNIVIAVSFIAVFAGPPLRLSGTALLLILAYVVVYMPHGGISVESALRQIGTDLEEASAIAGAGKGRTFAKVQLPLMLMGLGAGWAFLFVYIVGDLTASAMLASSQTPVIGFVVLDIWENAIFPHLAALSAVVTLLTSTVVLTVLHLTRRQRRRSLKRQGGVATTTPS